MCSVYSIARTRPRCSFAPIDVNHASELRPDQPFTLRRPFDLTEKRRKLPHKIGIVSYLGTMPRFFEHKIDIDVQRIGDAVAVVRIGALAVHPPGHRSRGHVNRAGEVRLRPFAPPQLAPQPC